MSPEVLRILAWFSIVAVILSFHVLLFCILPSINVVSRKEMFLNIFTTHVIVGMMVWFVWGVHYLTVIKNKHQLITENVNTQIVEKVDDNL